MWRSSGLSAAALVLLAATRLPAQEAGSEAVLLNDGPGGTVAIEAGYALHVSKLQGSIRIRTGKAGELRYETRALDDRSKPRPVGLWLRSGVLELGPLTAEEPPQPLWLEMAVPPGLGVEFDLAGSALEVAGLRSALVLRGAKLDVEARGIYGDVVVDVVDSEVGIDGVEGDVEVDGRALRLSLKNLSSYLNVEVGDTEVQATDVRGDADFDLGNSTFVGQEFQKALRVRAAGGRVELRNPRRDTELQLDQAPLLLSGATGRLTIESNADVRLEAVQAATTVSGYGARVQGSSGAGPLTVATTDGAVTLEQHNGKVRVEGESLAVDLRAIRGEVSIQTHSSEVRVAKVDGPLEVTNDFGDVHVEGTQQPVRVVNQDGSLFATAIGGPFEARVNGERVEVGWSAISAQGQHSIRNESGDVVARLPANALCRVEVESSYGTVRSDLPTVRVSDDRRFASGVLGSANQPLVEIHSAGDVLVTGAGGPTPTENPTQ